MTKLSEIALEKCIFVIQAIKEHFFNTELANGSLDMEKFAYYIEQDTLYLKDFARSLALIAAKVPPRFVKDFLSFSESALIVEQEVVHSFFRQTYNLKETGKLTLATLSYTSYLLQVSNTAPVEIAIASVLPCFWIYKIVGQFIAQNTDMKSQNPYKKWIETYSGPEFNTTLQRAIDIFDEIALSASYEVRNLMLDAFYKSTVLEWHFWNDAYNQTVFDALT
jgi:thiaminase (transcriptional activator TenA)